MKKRTKKVWLLVVLLSLFIPVTSAMAWWSGWYSPNFTGSYSPTSYKHGQWDSGLYSGSEVFGSTMKWNQTRANGVKAYSGTSKWISWCGYCKSYYTHDHTDMSHKLHAVAVSSNFSSPKYDFDDDNNNGWYEEAEVVAVSSSFPSVGAEYYFYSYFQRRKAGSGTVQETPAISAKPIWSSEYQTWYHDSYQSLSYTTGLGPLSLDPEQQTVEATVGTLLENTQMNTVLDYVAWAKTVPVDELSQAGVSQALTVVTFNAPMTVASLRDLGLAPDGYQVEMVKAVYLDSRNSDPLSNVWTIQLLVQNNDPFGELLAIERATEQQRFRGEGNRPVQLQIQGVVAVAMWLPLDTVNQLNTHPSVFVADASPSLARLVTNDRLTVEQLDSIHGAELSPDGLSSALRVDLSDVYAELQVLNEGE